MNSNDTLEAIGAELKVKREAAHQTLINGTDEQAMASLLEQLDPDDGHRDDFHDFFTSLGVAVYQCYWENDSLDSLDDILKAYIKVVRAEAAEDAADWDDKADKATRDAADNAYMKAEDEFDAAVSERFLFAD